MRLPLIFGLTGGVFLIQNLITLLSSSTSSPGTIVPTPRAYQTDENGEYIKVVKEIPREYTVPLNGAARSDASPEDAVVKEPMTISKKTKKKKKPVKPKLLTKSQYRFPWNYPEWRMNSCITPKADRFIIGASIEKSFRVGAPGIRNIKKSVKAVQSYLYRIK